MAKSKLSKSLSKRTSVMIILSAILFLVMIGASVGAFFGSIINEWNTRNQVRSISNNLDTVNSREALTQIAENSRILEILAVDKNGAIIYIVKNMALFSDPNATVLYDRETGLIKFDGERTSYFQRNSALGALLNVGDDDDWYDDDDDRIPSFDYRFVRDNTYQTIVLSDRGTGNAVYIVCTQNYHTGFLVYLVSAIVAWSLFVIYLMVTCSVAVGDNAKKHGANQMLWGTVGLVPILGVLAYTVYRIISKTCHECGQIEKRGNEFCTKCGVSLTPRQCKNCSTLAGRDDVVCGKCGTKLD